MSQTKLVETSTSNNKEVFGNLFGLDDYSLYFVIAFMIFLFLILSLNILLYLKRINMCGRLFDDENYDKSEMKVTDLKSSSLDSTI